jgi:hypothetical protein
MGGSKAEMSRQGRQARQENPKTKPGDIKHRCNRCDYNSLFLFKKCLGALGVPLEGVLKRSLGG